MPTPQDIKFSNLNLKGWRQFSDVSIQLHPQLTVITGANGSGKSTILNIFSGHFGYDRPYLSTPFRGKEGSYIFWPGITEFLQNPLPKRPANVIQVGEIAYSNNATAAACVPQNASVAYSLNIQNKPAIQGFHVASHRRMPNYLMVAQIPTQPILPAQAYANFNSEMSAAFQGGHSQFSSMYRIKEALLSMAVFGPGNRLVQPNVILMKTYEGFSDALRRILPEEIGFLDISIRPPDVVLVTKSGEFLIDAASGGLMALIDLIWQVYMFSLGTRSFVVTIDEPENHLHPAMQRTLMSNLVAAFPDVQFILATHSPFIVSAVRNARVYVLKHEDRNDVVPKGDVVDSQTRYVTSVCLESFNRAGTASQILRDVLGLPTTYPEWVRHDIDAIVNKYKDQAFSQELLISLRQELKESGYGDLYPEVTSKIAKG